MQTSEAIEETIVPIVHWISPDGTNQRAPSLLASLHPDPDRAFAQISEAEQPHGMWQLLMFPKGRERAFAIYFPDADHARKTVELWASRHWRSIEA